MKLSDVIKIFETNSPYTANEQLKGGYRLLKVFHSSSEEGSYVVYVLGKPADKKI